MGDKIGGTSTYASYIASKLFQRVQLTSSHQGIPSIPSPFLLVKCPPNASSFAAVTVFSVPSLFSFPSFYHLTFSAVLNRLPHLRLRRPPRLVRNFHLPLWCSCRCAYIIMGRQSELAQSGYPQARKLQDRAGRSRRRGTQYRDLA